jgi:Na+/alanine symporter
MSLFSLVYYGFSLILLNLKQLNSVPKKLLFIKAQEISSLVVFMDFLYSLIVLSLVKNISNPSEHFLTFKMLLYVIESNISYLRSGSFLFYV